MDARESSRSSKDRQLEQLPETPSFFVAGKRHWVWPACRWRLRGQTGGHRGEYPLGWVSGTAYVWSGGLACCLENDCVVISFKPADGSGTRFGRLQLGEVVRSGSLQSSLVLSMFQTALRIACSRATMAFMNSRRAANLLYFTPKYVVFDLDRAKAAMPRAPLR